MIDELQQKFGLGREIEFRAGQGDLTKMILQHSSGGRLEVYLHGGHITSWITPKLGEVLFMSSKAEFKAGKALRGGIPVIFPQFGPGAIVNHGFGRSMAWTVSKTAITPTGEVMAVLTLNDTDSTRAMWPHRFQVDYTVTLGQNLSTALSVTNQDAKPLEYTCALHTYFLVKDISKTVIEGLEGLEYLDKVRDGARGREERAGITIGEFNDRVYLDAPDKLAVIDRSWGRTITIQKRNLSDAVVWNPWSDKTPSFADLGESDYLRFICVEAGAVGTPVKVQPGETVTGGQILTCQ